MLSYIWRIFQFMPCCCEPAIWEPYTPQNILLMPQIYFSSCCNWSYPSIVFLLFKFINYIKWIRKVQNEAFTHFYFIWFSSISFHNVLVLLLSPILSALAWKYFFPACSQKFLPYSPLHKPVSFVMLYFILISGQFGTWVL